MVALTKGTDCAIFERVNGKWLMKVQWTGADIRSFECRGDLCLVVDAKATARVFTSNGRELIESVCQALPGPPRGSRIVGGGFLSASSIFVCDLSGKLWYVDLGRNEVKAAMLADQPIRKPKRFIDGVLQLADGVVISGSNRLACKVNESGMTELLAPGGMRDELCNLDSAAMLDGEPIFHGKLGGRHVIVRCVDEQPEVISSIEELCDGWPVEIGFPNGKPVIVQKNRLWTQQENGWKAVTFPEDHLLLAMAETNSGLALLIGDDGYSRVLSDSGLGASELIWADDLAIETRDYNWEHVLGAAVYDDARQKMVAQAAVLINLLAAKDLAAIALLTEGRGMSLAEIELALISLDGVEVRPSTARDLEQRVEFDAPTTSGSDAWCDMHCELSTDADEPDLYLSVRFRDDGGPYFKIEIEHLGME